MKTLTKINEMTIILGDLVKALAGDMVTNADMQAVETKHFGPCVSVHQGFLNRFRILLPIVRDVISMTHPSRVVFVGHSMGAAVAILFALEFRHKVPFSCLTLAAPIMGDENFRNATEHKFPLYIL